MMKRLWIENGTFVTMDDNRPVLKGHMVVEDDTILYLSEEAPDPLPEGAERINGQGLVFMPGLINTHGHAAMSLLRGYSDDQSLQVWLEQKMWPMEAKFTDDDVRSGTSLAVAEMLKSGTTSFVDMYDRMNIVAEVVQQSGIRASLTRGVIGLCPPDVQTSKLNEAKQFVRDWNGKAKGRITAMLSPHAPYTCPPDYIARIVEAAHELDVPLHTHMSESAAEVEQNVKDYGCRPVEHLDKLGFFSRPALLAHAVHLNDEEIALLANRGAAVSHNPGSIGSHRFLRSSAHIQKDCGVPRVPFLSRIANSLALVSSPFPTMLRPHRFSPLPLEHSLFHHEAEEIESYRLIVCRSASIPSKPIVPHADAAD